MLVADYPSLLLMGIPALVRVETGDLFHGFRGRRSQVLLKYNPVVIDHQGHHSRIVISRRPGNKREASDHLAPCHVVVGAPLRIGSLGLQDAVVITVVSDRLAPLTFGVALGLGTGDERAER